MNTLLLTDVYKMGHMEQYPADTVEVYSYCEARKPGLKTLFYGLQYILKAFLAQPVSHDDADEFLHYHNAILGEPSVGVRQKVHALADLGYWPLEIRAVPEGTVLDSRNILFSIRNTHPDFYWCVGFVESLLLKVWYPITVATGSRLYKTLVERFADQTCDNRDHVPFQVHDFGYRGVSSEDTAAIGGSAHLLNFHGSDTIIANWFLDRYYGAAASVKGLSVPASEHSVMCSYGRDGEYRAFDNMLDLYPRGIVSIVSDTYDYFRIMTDYAPSRKDRIMAREGRVVFRPDSGNPEEIICGTGADDSPQGMGSLELLWRNFGGTVNAKGYRVLDPHVGLIYGDGMFYERFEAILSHMQAQGFASSNLVIGVGGLLLQNHNRDELGFAIKATRIVRRQGSKVEIYKDPATDPSKRSKRGLMMLTRNAAGGYVTTDQVTDEQESTGELQTVFRDGALVREWTLDEVRARIAG